MRTVSSVIFGWFIYHTKTFLEIMEQLIEIVRDHPVLYDTSNDDYMRVKLKDKLWENIAVVLNYSSGEAAKEQWKKLRDCHRDALRRQQKKRTFQSGSVIRPWTYQKEMEFLLPFMTNRLTPSNDNEKNEGASDEKATGLYDNNAINNKPKIEPSSLTKRKKIENVSHNINKNIGSCDEEEAKQMDVLCKDLGEHQQQESDLQKDVLYQFFISMYNSTKEMPARYQLQVRRKLFDAVSQAEEDFLIERSHTCSTSILELTYASTPSTASP